MAVIVHVGHFTVGAKGGYRFNTALKLSNGLIRNGHFVLNFSDRDVARASSLIGHRKFGRAAVNRILVDYCRTHRPDLVLLGHADMIEAATIAAIRDAAPGVRVVQWYVDALFVPANYRRVEAKIDAVDATLVSTGVAALGPLRAGGRRVGFLPNPVDPSIETGENFRHASLPFDLIYACSEPNGVLRTICGRDWDMNDFMTALIAALPGLKPRLAGLHGQPRLTGVAYQDALLSSALGLNVSVRADWPLYSSDRIAQLVGNGLAVLIERATGYNALFGEDEMLFFSSFDELVEQIRRALADPAHRQAVAAAGWAKYFRLFNERVVARYLVDFAYDRVAPAAYGWPEGLV